jgi:hypothetical protein
MEQTDPRRRRTAARLAFADHVDYLAAGQCVPGSPKRTETLAGVNPPLDGQVVLLQDTIEVRHRPVLAAGVQRSFTLELSDRGRVSRMPIGVDDTRRGMVLLTQGFSQCASIAAHGAHRFLVSALSGASPGLLQHRANSIRSIRLNRSTDQ